jgi:hypothetical protein
VRDGLGRGAAVGPHAGEEEGKRRPLGPGRAGKRRGRRRRGRGGRGSGRKGRKEKGKKERKNGLAQIGIREGKCGRGMHHDHT